MGVIYENIDLVNMEDELQAKRGRIGSEEIRQMNISLLVDSGAVMLSINEEIRVALGLDIIDERPSELADGRKIRLPVAGPIKVMLQDRFSITNALVLPDDSTPLLGAIPMEEMDLWIKPTRNLLTFAHPDGQVMSLRNVR